MPRTILAAPLAVLLLSAPVFASAASPGETQALTVAPKKEPKLKPLLSKYKAAIAKPARDLKKAEADVILAFLDRAGFISLIKGYTNKDRKPPVIDGEALNWP